MPTLTPIEKLNYVWKWARKANAYGEIERLRLVYLPIRNILPEHFLGHRVFDVELLLVCLRAGAWLNGVDWHPYVRYTIAKRLKMRQDRLFTGDLAPYKQEVLHFQFKGGSHDQRDRLRKLSRSLSYGPTSTQHHKVMGKLISSIVDPIEENTYILPLHWIRTALATSQPFPGFGMNLYTSENELQKQTLCRFLKATIE